MFLAVLVGTQAEEKDMLLEVLLALLLLGAVGATLLTFFIRGDRKTPEAPQSATIDTDNPQRDIS
ncbi:MAG: hypothetical protein EBW31_00780 [Actinobacteria bacterium]|nr:hypothetical protein [Actinomycetota bacterium]NCV36981.1 hypothetical protein [Actinomycetota bacterium]NCV80534.1 hypothetical protein [Actinomycetota bacterium]NCV98071.1 hypothetical protein [Actinomycetota bacterium]NCW22622.1 hypothetical protein [Actinomycetota bacterium]